ncbi:MULTISPECIES: energy-coupling factor transporter ATPase [unclassified Candidatus Frackibacter]|uniref:energy-coupling factor transporter ATPase n=1 Tax=unclassified Candidatus Frackibacter TaxID=2648818 RepID=UPI0007957923|nr:MULTISPECIES: energy-coupling factor transporter ATPase [unclassified Candidatus Frackibacter]KXS45794.1 MAG: cobalt/nickel transport system ATP-binding protein [Candidatus Frackibacter sp. T328-2]SDC22722.1 energy-coupling factor transport system ATP-binding protein [Candidatus Frackibacter sp. WG11]SEM49167.1 energy-coupling factor transport system ATP-binding protein [Candidatus Frackibacter sp. WG12]SFL50757.1 energy-coupling factor transport system ATP-binding protein [Candidatus Fracki
MKPLIELNDVSYSYNGEEDFVLKDIDLNIEPGEFVAIVGHNGSGKSTLAKLLNGLLLPSKGEVKVGGLSTTSQEELWQIRQQVGMVFQSPDNQLVANIVEEDVAFGPENLGLPSEEIKARVKEALALVGMKDFARHAPHKLSGGQKQRVAIAGIIAMRPDCLVFDEPTAMLDPVGRKEVIKTVEDLNKNEGLSVVYITHFMNEVVNADRILVFEEGEIVLSGSPKDVFTKVDEIKELSLDVPQVTELAYHLQNSGLDIDSDIFTVNRLVEAICSLK